MSIMVLTRAFVLFSLTTMAASKEVCDRDDMSCRNRAKPNKGAAMFQASMSMQAQPTKTTQPAQTSTLTNVAKELMNKSPSQVVGEQVVKLISPSAATTTTIHALSSFVVYFIFTFAVAFMYRKYSQSKTDTACVQSNAEDLEAPSGFAYGLASPERCFSGDGMMCMLSFCCIGIRWADTMDKSRLASFWGALSVFVVCAGLSTYTMGFTTVILMCLVTYRRQTLRQKYNIEHGSVKTMLADFAVWWFCFPCAAVQEARQVEYVPPPKEVKVASK